MRVYSRPSPRNPRTLVWYAEVYYWERDRRKRSRRSTGIRDDGTRQSKRAAEAVGRDIQQSLALGKGRIARPPTIAKAIDKLIEDMERAGRAQPTINIVNEKAVHLFAFFGSTHPADAVTDQSMTEYADDALKSRVALTVQRELVTLCQALRAIKITPPAMPDFGDAYKPRERWLNLAETLRLKASTPPQWRDHVIMYRHLGLTKSELYRIEPGDISWERNTVRVRGTKTKARLRTLPMSDDVRAILWTRRNQQPMFKRWTNGDRDLPAAAVKAGLGRVTFNDLRRSFATELAAKGVPPLHLMHLMGHTSLRMLELVYARVGEGDHMQAAISKLDSLSGKPRGKGRKSP